MEGSAWEGGLELSDSHPQSSLLLLLLLLSPGLRGTPDCSFTHSPITSNFAIKIQELVSLLACVATVLGLDLGSLL